jgi:hypothetical protein
MSRGSFGGVKRSQYFLASASHSATNFGTRACVKRLVPAQLRIEFAE